MNDKKVLFKTRDVCVLQAHTGVISFDCNDKTDAMLDLSAAIFERDDELQQLRDDLQKANDTIGVHMAENYNLAKELATTKEYTHE